jgi:glycosyltransferase involved in cell wall biosynthesis
MNASPLRLTIVLTHPVQYFSPWFRYIAAERPDIDLTVLYGAIPSESQQGTGFGQAFSWDVPLTDGYRFVVCGNAAGERARFDSDSFLGVDVPDIGERILATRPDVVLVTGWHSIMHIRALRACRRHRIPVLYRGDSTRYSGPRGLVRPLWWLRTRAMLAQFDAYLSVGSDATEYLRSFGIPEPLVVRSPHCVENARFAEAAASRRPDRGRLRAALGVADNDFVVLYAGKLTARKRPVDAVQAVAGLGPSALLMIAGDGPLAAETRAAAESAGVRYSWRGFTNQSGMPDAFAAADCLIVPSAWETWGLVVNEALASGVPCVATTRVAASRDLIVDGVTGFVSPVGDVEHLTQSLRRVQTRLAEGHDFGDACRARVEAFSFEAATEGVSLASRRVRALAQQRVRAGESTAAPRVLLCGGGMVSLFGMERAVFEVLAVLKSSGAAIHGIVNRWESSRIVSRIESLDASWSTGYYWYQPQRRVRTPLHALQMAWDVVCTSAGLLKDAARFRPTHVIPGDFTTVLRNWPALLLLRVFGVTVVMSLQNAPDVTPFYRRLWRWVIAPAVDEIVANSKFTAGELLATGVAETKARVIYNTAPARESAVRLAGSPERRRQQGRIVYVGQMIPPKGIDRLLEAVATLRRRGLDVSLDAIGDIDGWEPPEWAGFRASLRERAQQSDLRGRVRFLGIREDVPALLSAAAVHCCPSRREIREAFGIVSVEAKAAGIPSVVCPTGGLPELIEHRVDGWICADDSVDALVEGLEYFLSDPTRCEAAGDAALASSARFSRETFASAWLEVFGIAPRHVTVVTAALPEQVGPHAH